MPVAKRNAVERELFETSDGTRITVGHFLPPTEELGIIIIPPLIGGSFLLFGRQFSHLVKNGFHVVSLNYRGHGKSEGIFDLRSSFSDTHEITVMLKERFPDLPLFAIGMCSGSMPIFYMLNQSHNLLNGVVFINAIYHLQQTATPLESLRMYFKNRRFSLPSSRGDFVAAVLDEVFPGIDKSADHFGILSFDRVNFNRVSAEFLLKLGPGNISKNLVPGLCLYGTDDQMLRLGDPQVEAEYRRQFERRFSNMQFDTFTTDHFMTAIRDEVSQRVFEFLIRTFSIGQPSSAAQSATRKLLQSTSHA